MADLSRLRRARAELRRAAADRQHGARAAEGTWSFGRIPQQQRTLFTAELPAQRTATDASIARLHELLAGFSAARFGADFEGRLHNGLAALRELPATRTGISALTVPPAASTAYYSTTISTLLDIVVAMSHLSKDAAIGNGISCYVNFLQAKEQAGIERATLTGVFAADAFTGESYRRFSQTVARQETFLSVFASFASPEQLHFLAETVSGPSIEAVARLRQVAADKSATGGFGVASGTWFDASSVRINLMKQVEDRLGADYAANAEQIKLAARQQFLLFAAVTALVLGVTLTASWRIVRGINLDMLRIASTLADGSHQVMAAAGQVSTSSQSMAEGASEQAASLEETSASLEEISSMTRRNAEAAGQAKDLSHQTIVAADSGSAEMETMQQAMDGIRVSATNIAKIVKSIDEIAFQTNILALNAAVEAARAGESGAGFAVVAEEVRALAQRSAAAARETSERIEDSVRKSEYGAQISGQVARHFTEIVQKARQVDALVAEISTSSKEQTEGIGQVNIAVAQMDKVTQSNAAVAEESAAGAEELNSQSVELTGVVGQLLAMVGGERANDPHGRPGTPRPGGKRPIDRLAGSESRPLRPLPRGQTVGPVHPRLTAGLPAIPGGDTTIDLFADR